MERAKLFVGGVAVGAAEASVTTYATIGRAPGNSLILDDQKVSRHHAVIRLREDDAYVLSDLGSSNGTFVNGRRVLLPERLRHKDTITIGGTSIVFHHPPSDPKPPPDEGTGDFTMMSDAPTSEPGVVGTSAAMSEVFGLMERAAASFIPVLVEGETGTGKELVARAIHHVSGRAKHPFVAVNCAALPETLLESQLFGHRRGAFTGADRDRIGLFESAHGGTIFLDEVGEMPMAMQAKFLRVLQQGEVVPLGETRPRVVDVRVISATNRDLAEEVERQRFRRDLYFRLSAFPIALPPLRHRRDDIPLLVERFLAQAAHQHHKRIRLVDDDAMAHLAAYDWPGNVRELQNEVQRAVALVDDGDTIRSHHLSLRLRTATPLRAEADRDRRPDTRASEEGETDGSPNLGDLRGAKAQFEARYIAEVLKQQGGNISRAAEVMGLSRMALHRKIKEYGIR